MKEFMEYVIKHLVDNPADVRVDEIIGEHTVIFELHVDPQDMGKVIGKQGRTARAMRTLLSAAAEKVNKKTRLDILE